MKVLNFGSLNIDHVYNVDHLVQPGETIASDSLEVFLGGKGFNQSIALARAGCKVFHAGMIGKDGEQLIQVLNNEGVDTENIRVSDSKTGQAIIQVDKLGQNSIIIYGGANQDVKKEFIDHVLENFSEGDIILLQNEISNIDYIMEEAKKKDMHIMFNPSPIDENISLLPLKNVTWFILNELEGMSITGEKDNAKVAWSMLKMFPNAKIILTLGNRGALYVDKDESHSFGVYDIEIKDTTGAGDTFAGFFLASVIEGNSIPISLQRASVASALAISEKGASDSIPTKEKVELHNLILK
ncbi:ribokinase [Paratissierella segnis]|uniref:Ribokinase n=1 Tax=Paratissierella segnis TaxID=2763679 RepID=A0A926EZ53_9FIRM|nr:ribokinase [Paratissierella segnis]MBC8588954.1 ribokinase [Paratissierella segnis]